MPEWLENPTLVSTGGTENLPTTNELKVDMHSKMLTAFPALTPLTVMLNVLAQDSAFNFRVDWQEEGQVPTTLVVGTEMAAAGGTLALVDNGTSCPVDTLIFNPDIFDMVRVTTATSDTSLAVDRSVAGYTAGIWAAGTVVHVLPPSLAENDATVRAIAAADTNVYNLMQVCKLQYAITRVQDKMASHFGGAGSKRQQLKRQKFEEVRKKYEKLIMFGGRSTGGTAPATKRTAGGLVHYLRSGTLYKDFNGILTETGFDNWLGDYWDQNPDSQNVKLFCAGNIQRLISYWGKDKLQLNPTSSGKYGFKIKTYIGGNFDVDVVPMPLLTDPVTKGWMWLLDMERLKLRVLDPLSFFPESLNVGESERIIDTYRLVTSLLVGNESRHAMAVGALV